MRRLTQAALSLGLLVIAGSARANGRFPSADQLLIDPQDASHWVLRATFGLLQSRDAGRSWSWVCEDAVGYAGEQDPALAVLSSGTVLAGYARDLRGSTTGGCSWRTIASEATNQNWLDATADPADPTSALFLTHSLKSDHLIQVFAVSDSGLSALDTPLGDDFSPATLEVAPSLTSRIYVSGILTDFTSVLFRSDDRGTQWARFPVHPDEGLPAYIAAVDPVNPERVYLRVDGDSSDFLLVSDDAGQNFSEAFSVQADMLGFALSPDGTRIVLGGPSVGLFSADASTLRFSPVPNSPSSVTCLKWTNETGLVACARESVDGFTLAQSSDGGANFTPLFHIRDLSPLACDASTDSGARCASKWPPVAKTLGIDTGTSTSTGGATGAKPSGGGCNFAIAPTSHGGLIALAALLCARLRRRTRRQGTSM